MPPRLPTVSGDTDTWGTVLNAFLSVAHNADGSLKSPILGVQFAGPVLASQVTQGLYARSTPTPAAGSAIFPMVSVGSDPNNPTYMWAFISATLHIGFTIDHGATFTDVIASPNAAQTIVQIVITANFMWVLTSAALSKSGQLWRSPAPNSTGSNIAFTKIFDLTGLVNGPGGAGGSGPSNSAFINACLAISADETHAYLLTYGQGNDSLTLGASNADCIMNVGSDIIFSPTGFNGTMDGKSGGVPISVAGAGAGGAALVTTVAEPYGVFKARLATAALTAVTAAIATFSATTFGAGVVVDGPRLYVSSNANTATPANVVFAQGFSWSFAKHGHAVKIIGGIPWVSLGDWPFPNGYTGSDGGLTHVGLWAATDATATAFNYKMPTTFATPFDMINFFAITIGGTNMIVGEADSRYGHGPTFFPSQSNAVGQLVPIVPTLPTALPQVTTMRCLTVTPEGNLMWLGTGEGGAVGPVDCIMIAYPPAFTQCVVLETSAALNNFGSGSVFNGVLDGPYVWFGSQRFTREKFLGQ